MAVNTLSKELNALLTTTMEKYRPTMADNVFNSNVTLAKLMDTDSVVRQGGGNEIVQPLMYAKNDTAQSYHGYDQFDTTPQDGISAAEFDWKQLGATISISRRERRQNSGEEALFNLVEKKVEQAEMSLQELVNNQLINAFEPGNQGKDLTPIPQIIAVDPTTSPSAQVGQIDGSTQSWWRNQAIASTATTLDGLEKELYQAYNMASRGGMSQRPDLVLMDQITFENYELGLDKRQRYEDARIADLGFEVLKLKGATVAWDEVIPDATNGNKFDLDATFDGGSNPATGTAYFINTKFLEFVIDSETEFETTDFKEPEDQDAAVAKILFMGELTVNNRRKHAVLHDIDRI